MWPGRAAAAGGRDLQTHFFTRRGVTRAVDGVSFTLRGRRDPGPRRGVGLGQVDDVPVAGAARPRAGRPHRRRPRAARRRGPAAARRPPRCGASGASRSPWCCRTRMTSLNPALTIGTQVGEVVRLHQGLRGRLAARAGAGRALAPAHPAPPARGCTHYQHQLSGGMRQRVSSAIAHVVRAAPAHRRRAHDRARRDHPGPVPRSAQGGAAVHRGGRHPRHPRLRHRGRQRRPRGRDVRGPDRGDRQHPARSSIAPAIPTRGRSCAACPTWSSKRQRLVGDRRAAARPRAAAARAVRSRRAAPSDSRSLRRRRTRRRCRWTTATWRTAGWRPPRDRRRVPR